MGLDTYFDVTFKRNDKKIEFPVIYMRKCYSMAQNLSNILCWGDFDATLKSKPTSESMIYYLENLRNAYQNEIDTLCSAPIGEIPDGIFDSVWPLPNYMHILHRCLYKVNITLLFFKGHIGFFDLTDCLGMDEEFVTETLGIDSDEQYDLGVKDFEYELSFCNSY